MRLSLEKVLEEKNVSIYRLAKSLNLSYNTTHSLVKGRSNTIKLDVLGKICSILGVEVQDIFRKN